MFDIIVAASKDNIIGVNNDIPWDYKEDIKYFRKITSQGDKNIIIMGYKTWESIGRILPNRINIVINRESKSEFEKVKENLYYSNDFNVLIQKINKDYKEYNTFVIGGEKIYREALNHYGCDKIYFTRINKKLVVKDEFKESIRRFPLLTNNYKLLEVNKGENKDLEFRIYEKVYSNHEELQYLLHVKNILDTEDVYKERTGTGIKSKFGIHMTYDISKHIPLLTTKRVFSRGIIEELLWFLRGETDNKILQEKNVHIWDGNTSREFLDSLGHTNRREGDGGPIYGFNFRHFGAKYIDCDTDYTGKGYDQVAEVIRLIREEPDSRRILINLWNPCVLKEGVLPPCFVKDTKVYTSNGYKNIQDIDENDKLMTHLGNIQKINKKYITKYSGEIHTLKPQYIPNITCTPNHPFYVKEVIYNKHTKLKIIKESEPEWITADKLTTNHFMGIKINDKSIIPKFTIKKRNKTYDFILDNNDLWLLMGYYIGNGWSRWDRKSIFYICCNIKNHEELINKFSKLVSSYSIKIKTDQCITYQMYSYDLSIILKKFGRKAHNKIIPEWVLNSPKELLKSFIEGYIKADGCYIKSKGNINMNITTTSVDLAYKSQLILLKLGYISGITFQKKNKKHIIENRVVNQRNLYSLRCIENRKRNIKSFIKDGYAWFQFKKNEVNIVKDINVYNFDVGEDHTYIVNNICTHNCHCLYQFRVYGDRLCCSMYQRSGDMGLGVPFNIASATLMTYLFAHLTGKKPWKLVHTIGDAHIYMNHIKPLEEQLKRKPLPFPLLHIEDRGQKCVEDYKASDFKISGYECHGRIKMDMAV